MEIDYYPNSIKAILDLKLDKLKKIKKEELKALKKKKIKKIRDFSDLSLEDYKELASEIEIDLETLNNIYIASNLISNAWNKRKVYLKKAQMKVVIAGLDYAGKTSLINRLIHNKNYYDLVNLKPTVGANVEEFQSDKLNMVIWDLGGQKGHIEEYLDDPEKYFIQVDLLIFVIDSQDDVRYDDAIKYLEDILNILKYLDEIPFILVLLNKADSDLIEDPDFQIKLEYLKDKISQKIKEHKINFNFDIVPTSIFNVYANEPEIAKSIKSIFSKPTEKVEDQKIPEIDKKVQKILDINLQFMDKVYSEIDEIKRILIRISPARISKNLFQVPFQSVESKKADEEREEKGKKSKQSKLPEPLKFIQKTEKKATEMKEAELKKLPQDKSGEIPPKIPSKKIEPRDLNPPPSPPKNTPEGKGVPIRPPPKHDRSKNIQRGNIRVNMLSELKELFVKRGIASEQISIQRPGEIKRTENSDMKKSDLERKKNKSHPDNEQHTNNISD